MASSVVGVHLSSVHGFSMPTVDKLVLRDGIGVRGDAHAGGIRPGDRIILQLPGVTRRALLPV